MKELILCFILCGNILCVSAENYKINVYNTSGETLDYNCLIGENELVTIIGHRTAPRDGFDCLRIDTQSNYSGDLIFKIKGVQFTIVVNVESLFSEYEMDIHLTRGLSYGDILLSGIYHEIKVTIISQQRIISSLIVVMGEEKRQS